MDPDHRTVASPHPVLGRGRVAFAEVVFGLLLKRPATVVGVQEPRPEARGADELLRFVAEDLLNLGADVAPAAVFAQLSGVDDDRKPLDQTAEIVSARGELVEESLYLVLGPIPI